MDNYEDMYNYNSCTVLSMRMGSKKQSRVGPSRLQESCVDWRMH